MRSNPRFTLLFCFLLAGVWAGSVVTYTVNKSPNFRSTAEVTLDAAGRIFNRKGNKGDGGGDTTPYDEKTAPPLGEAAPPIPEGMTFPAPTLEDVIADAPPAAAEPTAPTDMISGVLGSFTKLFGGEGNFSDILNIGMAVFALFGGAQLGGSDTLFKVILGLFSKKANFHAILEDTIDPPTPNRRRLLGKRGK